MSDWLRRAEPLQWSVCPLTLIIACATLAGASRPAVAQTTPSADEAGLSEVTVTARRRSESLQSVPEAITALNTQQIEDARIQKFGDFTAMTPNFEMFTTSSPGVFQMSIRGISQANEGDAPIVMVVDGVTLPYPNSFTLPLFDIKSIEVLKGPQGALYGQNAIGGAVVINTLQPTNRLEARGTVSWGKDNDNQQIGVISGPLIADTVLFRLAGFHHNFDGDARYAYAPENKENYLRDSLGRAELKFLPSATFTADLGISYGSTSSGAQPLVPVTYSPQSGIPAVSTDQVNSQLVLGAPNQDWHTHTRRNSLDGSLRLDWNAGFADFSSVTAGTRLREDNVQDLDVTNIPFVRLTGQPQVVDAFSQELRLTSPNQQRLRWTFGGFMAKVHRAQTNFVSGNLSLLAAGDANPADAIYIPLSDVLQDQHLNSYAGFAQVNYDLLPVLELTVAGRYDHDPRSQVSSSSTTPATREQRTFSKFQPKASVSYKPTGEQTYYFTYAQGFRPGGFNATQTSNTQPVFDPEETSTYEVGAKFSFFEHRASLSLSLYSTDYKNQQLTLVQVTATSATQNIFTVKKDKIRGVELEAEAQPLSGLDVGLGIGVQDGKIKEFGNSLTGAQFDPASYIDNKVPLQSQYTLNLSAQYAHALSNSLQGFVRTDITRKGLMYWYADNRVARPPFNLVNAKLGVRTQSWEVNIYGSNIFNKTYDSMYFDNKFVGAPGGFDFAYLAEKARYGLEATYRVQP